MKEQFPLNFNQESPDELANRLETLEHVLFDAKRTGDNHEYMKELEIEIEKLTQEIQDLPVQESNSEPIPQAEPIPHNKERTSSPESMMVKKAKELVDRGVPRAIAINQVLRGTSDKARRTYLNNFLYRKIK